MKKFSDLQSFLSHHKRVSQDVPITHTRIADADLGIYGGAYHIDQENEDEFYELYHEQVFVKGEQEFLTEKQLTEDPPILIDLDFKYDISVKDRLHTFKHLEDIVYLVYLETLKSIVEFEPDKPFDIFVFEKDHVNVVEEKGYTKDGIHIIIGIKMSHSAQKVLRLKVLELIPTIITDLPFINDWEHILDDCITKGSTNWQLYGSRKPGHEAYRLKQKYTITVDSYDKEFIDEKQVFDSDFVMDVEMLTKLSARYRGYPSFPIKLSLDSIRSHSKVTAVKSIPFKMTAFPFKIENITNTHALDCTIEHFLKSLNFSTDYVIKETHDFALTLPPKFWEPGSHMMNRKLAFALKNTDFRLFLTWIKVRSQSADFSFSTVGKLFQDWCKYFNNGDHEYNGLTYKSIMFWSRDEVPEKYKLVRSKTTDVFVDISLRSGLDYDYARTIYHMYKNEYICAQNTPKPIWYHFENHRWVKDKGNTLRLSISNSLFELYEAKLKFYQREMLELQERKSASKSSTTVTFTEADQIHEDRLTELLKNSTKNIKKLKQCSDKNNIYRETADIFFDKDFLSLMDRNKYLMCFSNGVMDFKNQVFRNGYPNDYITKSTNIPYVECATEYKADIEAFMSKLFPVPRLLTYMYDHLASCLIGENVNQTFHIYRGRGSNGKSLLTDFMAISLGEYAGTVPVTLITDKRCSTGGTQSEIIQLKGVRYAVMQEPSKDAKMNEGMMKQLSGDSIMQARQLYQESETFYIQFDMVVCLNELPKINSNDDGTWRRIRVVDFLSRFYSADDQSMTQDDDEEAKKNVHVKDPSLKDKLPMWAPTFLSMLVNRLFQTKGIVEPCKEVLEASTKYRKDQDCLSEFYFTRMKKDASAKTRIDDVKKRWMEFVKLNQYDKKPKELIDYLKGILKFDKVYFLNVSMVEEENPLNPESTS